MTTSPTYFDSPVVVADGPASARVWMAPGQVWTRFDELAGVVILRKGDPPLHARIEDRTYLCTPLTVH